jgi:ribonuclease P protein component
LVYDDGRSWAEKEIVLKALQNNLKLSRFGFVTSRRIGKAVVRNRIKRRLREISRLIKIKPGWDVVLIARNPAAESDYRSLEKSVRKLLVRADLIVGKDEGSSLMVN